jgi:hypothetical protein
MTRGLLLLGDVIIPEIGLWMITSAASRALYDLNHGTEFIMPLSWVSGTGRTDLSQ